MRTGKCDVCGQKIGKADPTNPDPTKPHTHTVSTTYESNNEEHWKICTGCTMEISGTRGTHKDGNMDGKCDTCGLVMSNGNNNGGKGKKIEEDPKDGNVVNDVKEKEMPYTGRKSIALVVIAVIGFVTLGAIEIKKYKEI